MTYTKRSKREELFDPVTRFLLVFNSNSGLVEDTPPPMPGSLPTRKGKERAGDVGLDDRELLGYCSFRFDTEQSAGPDNVEVIYW